jgi:hypothetical protein
MTLEMQMGGGGSTKFVRVSLYIYKTPHKKIQNPCARKDLDIQSNIALTEEMMTSPISALIYILYVYWYRCCKFAMGYCKIAIGPCCKNEIGYTS